MSVFRHFLQALPAAGGGGLAANGLQPALPAGGGGVAAHGLQLQQPALPFGGGAVAAHGLQLQQPALPAGGGAVAAHGLQLQQQEAVRCSDRRCGGAADGGGAAAAHGLQPPQPALPAGGSVAAQVRGLQARQQAEPQNDLLHACPLLGLARLRMSELHQRELLDERNAHQLRMLGFKERQVAAASPGPALLAQGGVLQLLQRETFEGSWQQLDAAWQQARTIEYAAWVQVWREQVRQASAGYPSRCSCC